MRVWHLQAIAAKKLPVAIQHSYTAGKKMEFIYMRPRVDSTTKEAISVPQAPAGLDAQAERHSQIHLCLRLLRYTANLI